MFCRTIQPHTAQNPNTQNYKVCKIIICILKGSKHTLLKTQTKEIFLSHISFDSRKLEMFHTSLQSQKYASVPLKDNEYGIIKLNGENSNFSVQVHFIFKSPNFDNIKM